MQKFIHSVVLGVSLLLLYGCTKAIYVPVERVVTKTVEKRDTIVLAKIERDTVRVVTHVDTVARAETYVAEAEASYSQGVLSLTLNNKNVEIPVEIDKEIVTVEVEVPTPYPVEIPKPYTPKVYTFAFIISIIIVTFWVVRVFKRFM